MTATWSAAQCVVDSLSSASPDVQAALISNLGIFFGALVTVAVTALIAIWQLKQERVEKSKDRALETKKEVLLASVDAGQGVIAAIGRFLNLAVGVDKISEDLQTAFARLAAAGAVASEETVRRGADLAREAGPHFMELAVLRMPLDSLQIDLNISQAQIDKFLSDNRMILELQRTAIASKRDDEAKFHSSVLQANHEAFKQEVAERDRIMDELTKLRAPFALDLVERQWAISDKLRLYVASVRVDIGVAESGEGYLQASYVDKEDVRKKLRASLTAMPEQAQSSTEAA